ncbi:MAG: hypothetical protein DMD74_07560 [Gemmatimonadetes bacterium]|nr:MAG: hypothetical protein DMD74_07560 [Gemmatimonadota bacterium]
MRRPILLLSFALWGCGSQAPGGATSQANDSQAVRTSGGPVGRVPAIAIRLAARGGIPRLYRLPSLTEVPDALRGRLPPVERVVGVDPEAAFLYVRTAKHELLALDLESSRADTVATDVEQATLGPDGTLFAVDAKKKVVSLARRARLAWPQPLGGVPRDLFGAADQRIVAVVAQDPPRLVTAGADQPPASRTLELGGDVAATRWGDLVAVASDSGVTLIDPLGRRGVAFVPIADHPRALAFSPSGHRIYVALRGGLGLAVIDRYAHEELDGVALPSAAATIRIDPLGRVAGGAADLWAVTSWLPRGGSRYTAQAAPVTAAGDSVGPEGPLYVQVSVSQNQDWSQRLAQELGRAGLPAKVLAPATTDEGYRVVLGPYPTREVAEGIGRKLGRPYWIYQPQPQP